ncbi:MAG: HDOD domain-containing protein [Chromatiales bacterium]|nr:HDOD domain-containing protein [Chromatiales bacterium]
MASQLSVDPNTLGAFVPLSELDAHARASLARSATVHIARKGDVLLSLGDDDPWTLFLIAGELELKAADGVTSRLVAGTASARTAISRLKPRKYEVRASSDVRYLRLADAALQHILTRREAEMPVELETGEMDGSSNSLYMAIFEDLNDDTLLLPSLPEVALRIRKAIDDDDSDLRAIARIVETSPSITAKLIKAANSPLYRGVNPITECTIAISRLGLKTTRHLVISLSVNELFRSQSKLLQRAMRDLWKHSIEVGALSFVLARLLPGYEPEEALLAGLLHDIGVVPVLSYAEDFPEVVNDPVGLHRVVTMLRGQVGAMILRKWSFAEEFVEVALEAEDWYRESTRTPDYTDLIQLAQIHSYVGSPRQSGVPDIERLTAYQRLAVGTLTPRRSLQVLDEARELVADARSLLAG